MSSSPPRASSLWFQTADAIAADDELPAGAEIVVAGGGLTGLATALLLARQGRHVVVVEARGVGSVTTGNTTGKLSLLQGDTLGELRDRAGDAALQAYVTANRTAQQWVRAEAADDPAVIQPVTACTYATTAAGDEAVAREAEALVGAGLDAELLEAASPTALPFPISSGLVMAEQSQLHPMRLLGLLAERLRAAGGSIVGGCRVVGAQLEEHGVRVETDRGAIACTAAVLATGIPVLDRGLFFAKLAPSRSLVGAYTLDDRMPPPGVFLSVDPESRSLRTAADATGRELLVVGSGSFVPGRIDSTAARLAELDDWTQEHFGPARRVTWWGAQDYRPVSRLPFAGELPRGGGRIYAATGYNKWGMTNAVAAAIAIAGTIAGDRPEWARELDAARPSLDAAGEAVAVNAEVAGGLIAGWLRAETGTIDEPPDDGEGRMIREGLRPVAEATVDGVTCRVSGVCTHLGGILEWNDAERSWDCPLHGSRFDAEGHLLEGPAVKDLERVDVDR